MNISDAHCEGPTITEMKDKEPQGKYLSHGLILVLHFKFFVGKLNELAFAAARRVVESATPLLTPYFYIVVGLGKTFMHEEAWEINSRQPNRKVMYLQLKNLWFIQALRHKDTLILKNNFAL